MLLRSPILLAASSSFGTMTDAAEQNGPQASSAASPSVVAGGDAAVDLSWEALPKKTRF